MEVEKNFKRHACIHSFICYVAGTGNEDEKDGAPIFEELTKVVLIFENLLKIKTTLANVLLEASF